MLAWRKVGSIDLLWGPRDKSGKQAAIGLLRETQPHIRHCRMPLDATIARLMRVRAGAIGPFYTVVCSAPCTDHIVRNYTFNITHLPAITHAMARIIRVKTSPGSESEASLRCGILKRDVQEGL